MMYKDLIFKNVSILCKYKKKNKFASKRFFFFFKLYIGIGLVVYSRMENNMYIRSESFHQEGKLGIIHLT